MDQQLGPGVALRGVIIIGKGEIDGAMILRLGAHLRRSDEVEALGRLHVALLHFRPQLARVKTDRKNPEQHKVLLVLGLYPDLDLPLLLEHPQQHRCAQPGADGSQIARQLRGLKGAGKALTHVCVCGGGGGGAGRSLAQRWCAT